jgi:hypothetical protein
MSAGMTYPGNHRKDVEQIGLRLLLAEVDGKRAIDRVAVCDDRRFQLSQLSDPHLSGGSAKGDRGFALCNEYRLYRGDSRTLGQRDLPYVAHGCGAFPDRIIHLSLSKFQPTLRSIACWFRRRFGDPARGVVAEHFLEKVGVATNTDRGYLALTQIKNMHALGANVRPSSVWPKFKRLQDDSRRSR